MNISKYIGGGIYRSVYKSPTPKTTSKAIDKPIIRKYKLCGVEVDEELYNEYRNKKFVVHQDGVEVERQLHSIEIYAKSKDFVEYDPKLNEESKKIVESIAKELREKTGAENMDDRKYNSLKECMDAIKEVYKQAVAMRQADLDALEMAKLKYNSAQKDGDIRAVTMAKFDIEDRQRDFDNSETYIKTLTPKINEIRAAYMEIVKDKYTPRADAIDKDFVSLLQSEILTEYEILDYVKKNPNNYTMLRIIEKYRVEHNIDNIEMRKYCELSKAKGDAEMYGFNTAVSLIEKLGDKTGLEIWGKEENYNKTMDPFITQIQDITQIQE